MVCRRLPCSRLTERSSPPSASYSIKSPDTVTFDFVVDSVVVLPTPLKEFEAMKSERITGEVTSSICLLNVF